MFSDRATIHVTAGRGGDGAVAFRREKFVPKGGPSGGDGGDGGNVALVATEGLRDLMLLRRTPHLRAEDGGHGEGSNRTGARGEDLEVPVPVGTQVFDAAGELICDLAVPRARAVIARGGCGGAGNRRFRTSVRQAPRTAEFGGAGGTGTFDLQLKLLADAALLGFPNVGKSSLLRRLSNAKPKVADYPFTTIEPVLGVVSVADDRQITVLDVPGLLEGAAEGHGLGLDFLAHLERARLLLHVVDAGQELEEAIRGFAAIHRELAHYQEALSRRPRLVVLNRVDLHGEDDPEALASRFGEALARLAGRDAEAVRDVIRDPGDGNPIVLPVSCATGYGVDVLKSALARWVPPEPETVGEVEPLPRFLVYRPGAADAGGVRVVRDESGVRLIGSALDEMLRTVGDAEAAALLADYVERTGLRPVLIRAGARKGIVVKVGERAISYRAG